MKIQQVALAISGSMIIALAHTSAPAQPPVITSFPGNGQLTWTNQPGTNGFAVQWAPAVTGTWSATWQALDAVITTSAQTTVSVPMFYRVAQGFSAASLRGTWMVGGANDLPYRGNAYFVAQDDGILSESGMFIPRAPAGFFDVVSNGTITLTFVERNDPAVVLTGKFFSQNEIVLDPPFEAAWVRRVEDVSLCSGAWSGVFAQTNGVGTPTNFPVNFNVDARGLVTSCTGFTPYVIGRVFALTNGAVAGFLFTSADDNDPYNSLRFGGLLASNTIQGVYGAEEKSVYGTVLLTR